jgi:hypothetical protein
MSDENANAKNPLFKCTMLIGVLTALMGLGAKVYEFQSARQEFNQAAKTGQSLPPAGPASPPVVAPVAAVEPAKVPVVHVWVSVSHDRNLCWEDTVVSIGDQKMQVLLSAANARGGKYFTLPVGRHTVTRTSRVCDWQHGRDAVRSLQRQETVEVSHEGQRLTVFSKIPDSVKNRSDRRDNFHGEAR